MINLIPNEEKKKMARGFYYRLAILLLLTLGACLFVAFLAMLPSYFLTSVKDRITNAKFETGASHELTPLDAATLAAAEDLDKKLSVIEGAQKTKFIVSEAVINSIVLKKTPSIRITGIFYENDPAQGPKITVSGTAGSREVLLLFRRSLEDVDSFKQVDLPISNFVKGSNIQFYINIIPRSLGDVAGGAS